LFPGADGGPIGHRLSPCSARSEIHRRITAKSSVAFFALDQTGEELLEYFFEVQELAISVLSFDYQMFLI
jgi:hypothetical protein